MLHPCGIILEILINLLSGIHMKIVLSILKEKLKKIIRKN
jgi:hypothetical protein